MKKLTIIFAVIIALAGVAFLFANSWYKKQINTQASNSSQLAEVEIEQGEGAQAIARKLQKAGVINNSDVFYLYVKLNKLAPNIQAGKFQIPQNLTIIQVAQTIQKAAGNDLWITIREGLRLDEVAEELDKTFLKEENSKFDKEEFTSIINNPDQYAIEGKLIAYKPEGKPLEGFLYPNTYNVPKDITSLELIKLLITTFEKKLESENVSIDSDKDLSAYEVIILGSIIEREARESEERYMISDILRKRLEGKMDGVKLLQVDATLLYEEKDWDAVITQELKERDSEYNTYKNTGLTPTPICNPGLDSIKAALNPKSNDYLFYLHDPEGKIHYAKTHSEHVNNQRCFINKNPDYCI